MSANVPTFTIPHYEENAESLQSLAKAKSSLWHRPSFAAEVIAVVSALLLFVVSPFSFFHRLPINKHFYNNETPLLPVILSVALLILIISSVFFFNGGPYMRKVAKTTVPMVEDFDILEKLEYWLKTNYGFRLGSEPSEVVQDLLINNAVTPKKRVYVNLIQDRDDGFPKYFSGVFAEKAPGVFELQKASISDTTESIYFTAISETGSERVTA